ncbi:MAG: hypothetical protein ACT4QE_22460 [Anaerolineales bacterium]
MNNDNEPNQDIHQGGVSAEVGGDLTTGRDMIGRDAITTTNVFHTDRRTTYGLLGILGLVSVGLLCVALVSIFRWSFTPAIENVPPVPTSAQVTSPATQALDLSSPTPAATSPMVLSTAISRPIQLPDGTTVTLVDDVGGYNYQYTVLSAQQEMLSAGKYLVRFRIRAWTNSGQGMGFWDDSFRLKIGDEILSPVGYLNQLVERDETKDADAEFEITDSINEGILVFSYRGETAELRFIIP